MIFDLAEKYYVPLNIHTDESDDPSDLSVLAIADLTEARGLQERVRCPLLLPGSTVN